MSSQNLDVEALMRSVAVGLTVAAIAYFVMRRRTEWTQTKQVAIMGLIGVTIIVVLYFAWPTVVSVPSLDGLSQAQAEDLLAKYRLRSEARPQYADGVDAGRVIGRSQNPSAGLPVRPGTVVSFAVAESRDTSLPINHPSSTVSVSLFQPKAGEKVRCSRDAEGVYRFSAQGTSSGLSDGQHGLLLWLRPVSPPADRIGWYLQRPPVNGIARVEPDGSWIGVAQLGNAQYPPHEGDTVDLAVTIVQKDVSDKLMGELGVVVRNQPVGVKSAISSRIILTLK